MSKKDEVKKAISDALADINKKFGTNSINKINEMDRVETVTSGSLSNDRALGGGFALGKIIEIYGDEACGKTGIALEFLREVQASGGNVAMIDFEHALDPNYANKIGLDVDNIYISQPKDFEEGAYVLERLVDTLSFDAILVDSVSAMTPRSEIEGETGEAKIGLQARLMSQLLRKITGKTNKAKCTIVFLNQIREKIGVMYGNPKTTSGGNALKFYASQRLEVKAVHIRGNDGNIGFTQRVRVVKNKAAAPFKVAERVIMYEEGVDLMKELIDIAVDLDIISRSGAWFNYGELKAQGKEKLSMLLEETPDAVIEIEKKIRAKFKSEE